MKLLRSALFLAGVVAALATQAAEVVKAPAPKIVFDNTPEQGIPKDAEAQQRGEPKDVGTVAQLLGDSVDTVRIRYFHKTWASEKEVSAYVAGLLAAPDNQVWTRQLWSQGVGVPEIECLLTFKDHSSCSGRRWAASATAKASGGSLARRNTFIASTRKGIVTSTAPLAPVRARTSGQGEA